jgi:hypothetical protein
MEWASDEYVFGGVAEFWAAVRAGWGVGFSYSVEVRVEGYVAQACLYQEGGLSAG